MLTLGVAKQRLASFASADDLVERINLACELLLTGQDHKGSIEKVAFSVTDGLLTLPRQYFGCLGTTVQDFPHPIYNQWYEFVGSGPGTCESACRAVIDLGDGYVTTQDISAIDDDGALLKVTSELTEDAGLEILLRGLDADLATIYTTDSGERVEGEYVDLAVAGTTSASTFTSLKQVIKPVTKGRVYVYVVGTTDTLIATYEPSEERPSYRRYRVPELTDEDETTSVVALCQRRHVDVADDNDPLPVDNMNALRDAMLSLEYKSQNDLERAGTYLQSAMQLLSKEHQRYQPAASYPSALNMPGYLPIRSFY